MAIYSECMVFPTFTPTLRPMGGTTTRSSPTPWGSSRVCLTRMARRFTRGDVVDFVAYDAFGNERGNEQGVVSFTFCAYQIGGYDMYDVLLNDDCAEVIGNIHDNPELMKQNE